MLKVSLSDRRSFGSSCSSIAAKLGTCWRGSYFTANAESSGNATVSCEYGTSRALLAGAPLAGCQHERGGTQSNVPDQERTSPGNRASAIEARPTGRHLDQRARNSKMTTPRHFRVFLSSPGDVSEERVHARKVIKEELPSDPFLRSRATLEIVSWDDPSSPTPMLASLTPQEAIDRGLPKPSECDFVVVILWGRFGTPLPDSTRKPNGERYLSGTEWCHQRREFHPKPAV
jgi:hypothetical protein